MANSASQSSHHHSEQESHVPFPPRGQYGNRQDLWRPPRDLLTRPVPTATELQRIATHGHVEALADLARRMGLRSPAESVNGSPEPVPEDPSGTPGDEEITVRHLLLTDDENLLSRVIEQLAQRRDLLRCVDARVEALDLPPTPAQSPPGLSSEPSDVGKQGESRPNYNTGATQRHPSPGAPSVGSSLGNDESSGISQESAAASLDPKDLISVNRVCEQGVRIPWRAGRALVVRLPDPSNYTLASNEATNFTELRRNHDANQPWVFIPSGHQQTAMSSSLETTETTRAAPVNFGEAWSREDWDFTFSIPPRPAPGLFATPFGQNDQNRNFTFRA